MNQGKLELVKQEMARVNIDILGNSELKWTGTSQILRDLKNVLFQAIKDANCTLTSPIQVNCSILEFLPITGIF